MAEALTQEERAAQRLANSPPDNELWPDLPDGCRIVLDPLHPLVVAGDGAVYREFDSNTATATWRVPDVEAGNRVAEQLRDTYGDG